MKQKKIIDLTVKRIFDQSEYPRHIIMLTYDDTTKKEIFLYGDELSRILNKKFESIHLEEIFFNGKFSGNFMLEANIKGYFNTKTHREILTMKNVIALFNERSYLVDIDNKKCLLDLQQNYKKTHGNTRLEYRLIGLGKNEATGVIRQEDTSDAKLQKNSNDVINDDKNCETWMNRILDVTTKRGHTNTDHTPSKIELEPYRPHQKSKDQLVLDEDSMMYYIDESPSSMTLKRKI